MKNKAQQQYDKYSIVISEVATPSMNSILEKKIARWFPNLSRETIASKLQQLPFSINNLPFKAASRIKEDLVQIGCAVELRPKETSFESQQDVLTSPRIKVPPVRPPSHLKDFFSSSYLTSFVHPKSHVAEAFRTLRTNLQFTRNSREMKVLLVTSSNEDEGKSTVATNLAISMAQTNTSVLLIDADLRQPSIHRAFGYEKSVGLSSILRFNKDPQECISPTFIKNLSVLFAGPSPPNPSELLGLNEMKELLNYLKEKYELVIVDSPPVISVTDPVILTSMVDGMYLVLSAGKTSKKAAQYALEVLSGVNAKILGVILNNFKYEHHFYYQHYYSNYYSEGN